MQEQMTKLATSLEQQSGYCGVNTTRHGNGHPSPKHAVRARSSLVHVPRPRPHWEARANETMRAGSQIASHTLLRGVAYAQARAEMAEAEWKLFYWHVLPGRGDYVRLMFEEAGVQYEDVCRVQNSSEACVKFYKWENEGFPVIAPPIIQHGEFVLNETPAILQYLGRKFKLYPEGGLEVEARAMQIVEVVLDYHAEGHDAFHPVKKSGTYDSQKKEAEPQIAAFRKDRLPR